jgi:hypothetical protein
MTIGFLFKGGWLFPTDKAEASDVWVMRKGFTREVNNFPGINTSFLSGRNSGRRRKLGEKETPGLGKPHLLEGVGP